MNDTIHMSATDERLIPGTIVFSAGGIVYLVIASDDDRLRMIRTVNGSIDNMSLQRKHYEGGPLFVHARLVLVPT